MTDSPTPRQPWISDLTIAVRGNITVMSSRSGDIGAAAEGIYVDDRRVVSLARLRVDGGEVVPIVASARGGRSMSLAVARQLGDPGPDPTVGVRRTKTIHADGVDEVVSLESRAEKPVVASLELQLASDGTDLHDIKGGRVDVRRRTPDRVTADTATWIDDRHETSVLLTPAPEELSESGGIVTARWDVVVDPGSSVSVTVSCCARRATRSDFDAGPGAERLSLGHIAARAADDRIGQLSAVSAGDLEGLLLTDPLERADCFAAAGTPWYLTLFGRDSIWAARMALPYGTDLAGGTLRALARRQGVRVDVASAEEPGKMLHEVRRTTFDDPSSDLRLPPVYYGTVDATALWVVLLHDAWRWGLPESQVRALWSNLTAAMEWIERSEESGGGLLRYQDVTGVGLSNQGWKDSGDSMRRRDGSIAPAPIALVETMAYSVEAARKAASLAAALYGDEASDLQARWEALAVRLIATVRERFWVRDDAGPYLSMAIDGQGRHVDGVGSNMGHVLGTGTLSHAEARCVADRLLGPDMLRSFGIGTLSKDNPGYNPVGYHSGSVWVHDTVICAMGLAAEGFGTEALEVVRRILDLSARVGYRLPELLSGEDVLGEPAPYPASCRPQAWAAASGVALAPLLLGLRADAQRGTLTTAPIDPAAVGHLALEGVRLAGHAVAVEVTASGEVIAQADGGVRVVAERMTQ